MNPDELQESLEEYKKQFTLVTESLQVCNDVTEKESLLSLQNDLSQLISLTQESLDAVIPKEKAKDDGFKQNKSQLDDEYALFMEEMAKTGAYNECNSNESNDGNENKSDDIESELATLLGMKCAVYHTHKWGGQPSLHNAMVSAVVPRQESDMFQDLQVQVLFTHPTHSEMLPCPFYLEGECRFDDDQCRYSHGTVVPLSNLKEAIEPDFDAVKVGSRVLVKLKPPDTEDMTLKKKSSEKYHLWHRSIVKSVDLDNRMCIAKLEHGLKTGEKRKSAIDELNMSFEHIFPLNNECLSDSSTSDDSLSDTEYPQTKSTKSDLVGEDKRSLVIEKSLQGNGPALGQWERHTRGIGSKIMFSMGYVAGTGLGAASDGRLQPVEARVMPVGKSLDHCMAISEKMGSQDPLKVEQKLKRLQKKEEERQRRAYEREKEKERRNVFNFLNKTLGDQPETSAVASTTNIKNSSCNDLNVEQFKINEGTKRLEKEIIKLNQSLSRHSDGTLGHKTVKVQIFEKTKELNILKNKEKQISKEQMDRKNKQKMTVF